MAQPKQWKVAWATLAVLLQTLLQLPAAWCQQPASGSCDACRNAQPVPDIGQQLADLQHQVAALLALTNQTAAAATPVETLVAASSAAAAARSYSYRLQGALALALLVAGAAWLVRAQLARLLWRNSQRELGHALQSMDTDTVKSMLGTENIPTWMHTPDHQRVGWVNEVLEQVWPRVSALATAQANLILEPVIRQSKPSWVHDVQLLQARFGTIPPTVSSVKVFPSDDPGQEVVMEFEFRWAGNQTIHLHIKPFPKSSLLHSGLAAFLANLLSVKVSIEAIICSGRLRVALKPLMDAFPIVQSVQASLVEMPRFSMQTNVYGGDVTLLPGIEAWLHMFIRDRILRPYVLPDRIVIPLAPGAPTSWVPQPEGMLFVTLVEATHVPRMDLLTSSDPFVKLSVRATRKLRSRVIRRTTHPVWNEEFQLLVHERGVQALELVLYDHDTMSRSDEIGRAQLRLADLPAAAEQDLWLDVAPPPDAARGSRSYRKAWQALQEDVKGHLEQAAAHSKLAQRAGLFQPCRLHLKVTYQPFTEQEQQVLRESSSGRAATAPASPRHDASPAVLPVSPAIDAPLAEGDSQDEAVGAADNPALPGGGTRTVPAAGEARGGSAPGDAADAVSPHDARLLNVLRGGVLYVRLVKALGVGHKPAWKGGFLPRLLRARVVVGREKRYSSPAAGDSSAALWDELLEFVVPADVVRGQASCVSVQLWDYRLKNHFLGAVEVPLCEVVHRRDWEGTWPLAGVRHGHLTMHLRWMGILHAA